MAELDLQIAASRAIIADLKTHVATHKQRVAVLGSSLRRLGLQGEQGDQWRKALERELAAETDLLERLDRLLDAELERLRRLQEQLERVRPQAPQFKHG